jgi:hypothetical protein
MKRSLWHVPWYIYPGYIVGIIGMLGYILIDHRWLWSAGIFVFLLNNVWFWLVRQKRDLEQCGRS